jgi:hypothetical protein
MTREELIFKKREVQRQMDELKETADATPLAKAALGEMEVRILSRESQT